MVRVSQTASDTPEKPQVTAMEDAMPTYQRTFPGDPQELRAARNWTRATLDGHPHSEDAALIVTELGTNAVLHTASGDTAGTFHVTLTISRVDHHDRGDRLRRAKTTPAGPASAPQRQPHGRGLGMVTALADHVVVQGDDSGRTIAAHLTANEEAS